MRLKDKKAQIRFPFSYTIFKSYDERVGRDFQNKEAWEGKYNFREFEKASLKNGFEVIPL